MSETHRNNTVTPQAPKAIKTQISKWLTARKFVQAIVFILFISFIFTSLRGIEPLAQIFFQIDPLTAITSMLSSRTFILAMLPGLLILLLSFIFGRFWCGWLCPMGSLLDWIPSRKKNKTANSASYWLEIKHVLAMVILFMAILGSLTLIILDPLTLFSRALSSSIIPALGLLFKNIANFLSSITPLKNAGSNLYLIANSWFITGQSFYLPNIFILLIFLLILGLNAVKSRFWCRYLCPLGGLLSLAGKISIFGIKRNKETCKSCAQCKTVCPTGAITEKNDYNVINNECVLCLNCIDKCRFNSFQYSRRASSNAPSQHSPSRRQFLYSLAGAIAGALLLKYLPKVDSQTTNNLRPPGASEQSLEEKCIRCGLCIKTCPTGVIQPSSSAVLWDRVWTPELVTRHGYCSYNCNACGKICPSGAILPLTLEEKNQYVIGRARIDHERCIPWSRGQNCGVCEEVCPLPNKAIRFINGDGGKVNLPEVINNRCIGCGTCEYYCPVEGEAAIRVFNAENAGGGQGRRRQAHGNRNY